ncbi:hypothetical protein V8C26DRAFT_381497 [Trichoderma gracile]
MSRHWHGPGAERRDGHGMAWHGHLRQAITSQAVPVGPASRSSPAPTRLPDGKCIGRPDHRQKGGGWTTAPAGRLAGWRVGEGGKELEGTTAANKLAFSLGAPTNSTGLGRQSFTSPAMDQLGCKCAVHAEPVFAKRPWTTNTALCMHHLLARGAEMHRLWTSITHANQPAMMRTRHDGNKKRLEAKTQLGCGLGSLETI